MTRPPGATARVLAISMGDPTGIGPEVTLKALGQKRRAKVILVGDPAVYEDTARALGLALRFEPWCPGMARPRHGVPVLVVSELPAAMRRPGHPSTEGGKAAYVAILEAVRLVQEGYASALVTAPICKANLIAAGASTPGHTELLARLARTDRVRMMMVGRRLRVMLVTTHVAIAQLPREVTTTAVLETIQVANDTLRRQFGIKRPRIAVCGLNPHAGEGGLFGNEESRAIAPAIKSARRRGILAAGPLAADGLFPHVAAGEWDIAICMYHDQGLAPFKLLHFADGVNFTAGLPFVRTSPDHGTAHDIAGQRIADPRSMGAALDLAHHLSGLTRG